MGVCMGQGQRPGRAASCSSMVRSARTVPRSQKAVAFRLLSTPVAGARYVEDEGLEELGCVEMQLPPAWAHGLAATSDYSVEVGSAQGSGGNQVRSHPI
jgi:hypothetical protein